MSLPNTKDPGDTLSVVVTFTHIEFIAVAIAWSIISAALATVLGGLVSSRTQSTFPTVWCILSQIALAWGFQLVVGTSLIEAAFNKSWNSQLVNSPPLSWMHLFGQWYLANQDCSHLDLICAQVFLLTLMSLTRLVTKSILVRALNSYHLSLIFILHGPIISTATSCQGCVLTSRPGRNPKPRPDSLYLLHVSQKKVIYAQEHLREIIRS